jgi:hypothetical protein
MVYSDTKTQDSKIVLWTRGASLVSDIMVEFPELQSEGK